MGKNVFSLKIFRNCLTLILVKGVKYCLLVTFFTFLHKKMANPQITNSEISSHFSLLEIKPKK